ncbi:MAG: SHOCT domain-containing protein [Colwellia sp.]|nr:SHOCT domain-containing protein [Colwellia sp.]MCW8864768.1 SHOCT domain-containing protein [Colwellia sp.]MCW9081861.1 SHOCT domain-containing protein [Colwellia sp.]
MTAITFKRHFVKDRLFSPLLYWLVSLFIFYSGHIAANSNSYQLNIISQLNHHTSSANNWQQIIANPNNKEQFFVINDAGQLYLSTGIIEENAILTLSNNVTKFTAITLHPSFSLRDQTGYGTFYTSHIEPIDKKSTTKRLQERSAELPLEFDAVITEWQFQSVNHQKVDMSTKREVLRVAVPDESFAINQLAFNPAAKSWNDNYGLLYMSLSGNQKWQQPLYSGVILRIHPAQFGLRSFTVPSSNPFLKDSKIKDAIYLLGAQKIQQFIWPDKNSEQLLLMHQYNEKHMLSLTTGRDDWRSNSPKKVLYQSDQAVNDIVMYRGRNLAYLRNKLLLFSQQEQGWLIESLVFKRSFSANDYEENKPQIEWLFTSQQLPENSQPSLSVNASGEVLILDNYENMLYLLSQENPTELAIAAREELPSTASSSDNKFLLFLFFVMVAAAFYYWSKRNKFSAKKLVRQQFAHLELSASQQQIGLYRRHKKNAETILDLADIVSSEIQLNDQSVNLINEDSGHGFSNDKDQDLRAVFTKEHVDKMVDGKIRQISLQLTDKDKHIYSVCLYLRKGSNRITKKSYFKVVDYLIDWCWFIGKQLNPTQTGKRKAKAIVKSSETTQGAVKKNVTPLHNQAAAIRPVTHKAVGKSTSIPEAGVQPKPKVRVDNAASSQTVDNSSAQPKAQKVSGTSVNENAKSTIDTELVNALEKLVNLKQQGFLTADEFAQAKAKLLKNLFNKSS